MSKVATIRHDAGKESTMTMRQIADMLCEIQEELQIKGYDDAAAMIHRACNKISASIVGVDHARRMETKKPQ